MRKAALSFQPRVSLKNASALITLSLMGFGETCPLPIFGRGFGKVVIIDTNEAMSEAGHTN